MKQKQTKEQPNRTQTPANSYPPAPKNDIEKEMLEEIVEKQKQVKK